MARSTRVLHSWPRLIALLLLLGGGLPQVAQAAPPALRLETRYFTILYPPGEEQTAQWYASFADDVDTAVSEMLGADPVSGITLDIYATETEYQQANPAAGLLPGILAHAIPEQKEVGVAVERLRQQPPQLARQSFRHEMTHIVAGALTNNTLPLGFNEGLAQYNELSTDRAQEVVMLLQTAKDQGEAPLSWRDLNNERTFWDQIDLAYPQSYTVMAFLAERFGMGAYGRFLRALHDGEPYPAALRTAYGMSLEVLDAQWRAFLPGFLKNGWQHNVLVDYDLTPARDLYQAGQFAAARDRFAASERLYRDLGRTARAAEIATDRSNADQAQGAADLTAQARQALDAHDYAAAHDQATRAAAMFARLVLADFRTQAQAIADPAGQGLAALGQLQQARDARARLDLAGAQAAARQAGIIFAGLGDSARLADADAILADLWRWQRGLGLGLLGGGVLALMLAGLVAWRLRRRPRAAPLTLGEETPSWL